MAGLHGVWIRGKDRDAFKVQRGHGIQDTVVSISWQQGQNCASNSTNGILWHGLLIFLLFCKHPHEVSYSHHPFPLQVCHVHRSSSQPLERRTRYIILRGPIELNGTVLPLED